MTGRAFSRIPASFRRWLLGPCLALPAALPACSSSDGPGGADALGYAIPAEAQSQGDPVAGRETLLNGSYMSCGIPWKLWQDPTYGPATRGSFGTSTTETIPGRTGLNANLPYNLNAFTTTDGATVVNRNCLTCHGGHFDGELIIGLGNPAADFTTQLGAGITPALIQTLTTQTGLDAAESANLGKVFRFGAALGPALTMRTIGLNPAEQLTGSLISHHDLQTLAWSDAPLVEVNLPTDSAGNPIPDAKLTSDPPPWWRAHKKNALFYNAMARGEHRGTMALATAICVDNLDEAHRVDTLFKDIQAFIGSVRPPKYKRTVDLAMAADGKKVFNATCSRCHGTYATDPSDDAHDTYPNLLIPLDTIGTDPAVAQAPLINPREVEWYNKSFYGSITRAEPDNPFPGYVPPPLDGIWATAPYLHNASVPNVALLLNSTKRPKYWKRVDYDDTNFDEDNLGWPFVEVPYSQADAPAAEQKYIYDTTYYSQTNGGHTFGDALTDTERRAVIEYLKTL